MNRSTQQAQADRIVAMIGGHPAGVSVRTMALAFSASENLARRTLQRRLDRLIEQGRIVAEGAGRSVVYKLAGQAAADTPEPPSANTPPAPVDNYVPVSQAGMAVRAAVCMPLMARRPVGYRRAFLTDYRPNVDAYLTPAQRDRLHRLGRTSAGTAPAGTYARDILGRLLIDLSWASSRLEGNTYSRLDTMRLIEQGEAAQGKDAQETQMILNHKAAIEMLVDGADEVGFNRFTVLNLHAILSDNLMADPLTSGRLRTREVDISGTVFVPLGVPQQIEECFDALLDRASHIRDPFEQAFFGMVHLPYLQPFEDVNKRVSRLTANIPLIRDNLCPLSFVDVPNDAYIEGTLGVYELNRVDLLADVFVWAYERSCQRYLAIQQSIGQPDALRLKYRNALMGVVQAVVRDGLRGTREELLALADRHGVAGIDATFFADAVAGDLNRLYSGNIARYRLRLSEFDAWPYRRSPEA